VLAVAGRNRPVSDQELSRCIAIVGIMELALNNALAHQRSQRAALTDPLTSLVNRRGMERLVHERRGRRALAVPAIDVDRLKAVNDRHGHAAGDELLLLVVDAIRSVVRAGAVVTRVGGDEFACVAFDADEEAAVLGATRMLNAVRSADHRGWAPSVSIGVAAPSSGSPSPRFSIEQTRRCISPSAREACAARLLAPPRVQSPPSTKPLPRI
jgi:diguanylate cyclase (GGDEF)-like protein